MTARNGRPGRLDAYVDAAVAGALRSVSNTGTGGRGLALYAAAARLGSFVALGLAHRGEIRAALLDAARCNRLAQDDGEAAVLRHIDRGLTHGGARVADIRADLERRGLWDRSPRPPARPPAPSAEHRSRERVWRGAWNESGDIAGSPVEPYLCQVRAVVDRTSLPELNEALRWHPGAPLALRDNGSVWRAQHGGMLALIRDNLIGEPIGLQVTALARGGRGKATMAKPKRTWGRMKGGAVRLAAIQVGAWSECLAVAEGVESGLAFMRITGVPTWVALGSGNLGSLTPPSIATHLIAAVDHDQSGLAAAAELVARLRSDHDVETIHPSTPDEDWANVAERLYAKGGRHAA